MKIKKKNKPIYRWRVIEKLSLNKRKKNFYYYQCFGSEYTGTGMYYRGIMQIKTQNLIKLHLNPDPGG